MRAYLVSSALSLPKTLKKVKQDFKDEYWFLVLPDPVFILGAGKDYLTEFLRKHPIKGLDLMGLKESPLPKVESKPEDLARIILKYLNREKCGIVFSDLSEARH